MDETVLKNLKTRAMEESKKYDISRSKIAFEFALSEIVKDKKYAHRH